MKQSFRALRILLCAVIMVLCFVVESSLGIRISVFGAHFDFLPPLVAASALCLGCPAGLVCGTLAGLLYDVSGAGIQGLYPIYYMIFGIFCGLMGESRHTQTHRLRRTILLALGMPMLLSVIRYLFYFQFISETGLPFVLQCLALQAILTVVLCLPVYWLITRISGVHGSRRKPDERRGQMDE
ncbi:MAG: rod shape-determining protein MreD [Eubacteriales bacterium]|nr:rod shape-determining protein MreD [Eubacteriales bacterium]